MRIALGAQAAAAAAAAWAQVVEPAQQARIALAARPHFPDFTQVINYILNVHQAPPEAPASESDAPSDTVIPS